MALIATIETKFGFDEELYLRVNSIEASNHGVESVALIRGFISEEAFKNGSHYIHEQQVTFNADVSQNLWEQAYLALKEQVKGVDA